MMDVERVMEDEWFGEDINNVLSSIVLVRNDRRVFIIWVDGFSSASLTE